MCSLHRGSECQWSHNGILGIINKQRWVSELVLGFNCHCCIKESPHLAIDKLAGCAGELGDQVDPMFTGMVCARIILIKR